MKKLFLLLVFFVACKKESVEFKPGSQLSFTRLYIDTTQHGIGLREPLIAIRDSANLCLCQDSNTPHLYWWLPFNQLVKY